MVKNQFRKFDKGCFLLSVRAFVLLLCCAVLLLAFMFVRWLGDLGDCFVRFVW